MDITDFYGYGANPDACKARLQSLIGQHEKLFGTSPDAVFSTSGRTELAGNHTDHNNGKVLAGAINLDTIAAVHETMDYEISIISEGYSPIQIDVSDLNPHKEEEGKTESLIRGVAAAIVDRGGCIGGFCANVSSTVLKGSGLSSSASFEVLIATIFNEMFNDSRFSTTELAIMGQEAENKYFGKPSGLMDQVACANGGIVMIDFKDNANPIIKPIKVDFSEYGYNLVIVNTGGNHADLTQDYASIPTDMKKVASFFGKPVLRDVEPTVFFDNIKAVREKLGDDRAVLRAWHYFKENERVDKMLAALESKDFVKYLSYISESGNSSYKYLQNIYSPSAFDQQGISMAYALTENFLSSSCNGKGACRIQGGGFAGTLEAYIPTDKTDDYYRYMEKVFGEGCCTTLAIRNKPTTRIM